MAELSANDINILKEIQKDRKEPLTGAEIAERTGLSTSAVSDKLKRFRAEGLIESWAAQLHAKKIGMEIIAFVGVSLQNNNKDTLDKFESIFLNNKENFPEVIECYLLTGSYDYLLKIAVANMDDYYKFIRIKMPAVNMIGKLTTMHVLSELRFTTELPLDNLKPTNRRS